MNKTLAESLDYAERLLRSPDYSSINRFVIPPFTTVRQVKETLASSNIRVGAQNMHWCDEGAWTGEISPQMLTDCAVDIIELGHSERRAYFAETDDTVSLKVAAAVSHGLTPLICVGETRQQRDQGLSDQVLKEQVMIALSGLTESDKGAPLLIAYEPVWAIGEGGEPATADYANRRQELIINTAEKVLGVRVPCLYGGSVNAGNCEELIVCENIDGLFIGRAAWGVEGYLDILARCAAKI